MLGILMAMLGGASMFHISLGIMDSILCFSPEKMIYDEEIFLRCAHITAAPSLKDEDFGVELLKEVGPGGSFLTHKSTQKNFRKLWMPTISNWDSYQSWESQGKPPLAQKAAAMVAKRLEIAGQTTYLSPDAEKAISQLVG
jgi:trimethylamine--corrinoid protein Co-methyltransferase